MDDSRKEEVQRKYGGKTLHVICVKVLLDTDILKDQQQGLDQIKNQPLTLNGKEGFQRWEEVIHLQVTRKSTSYKQVTRKP